MLGFSARLRIMRSKYVPSCRTLELQLNVIYSDPLSREHFAPVLLDFHSTSALHDAGQESKSSKANTDPPLLLQQSMLEKTPTMARSRAQYSNESFRPACVQELMPKQNTAKSAQLRL